MKESTKKYSLAFFSVFSVIPIVIIGHRLFGINAGDFYGELILTGIWLSFLFLGVRNIGVVSK